MDRNSRFMLSKDIIRKHTQKTQTEVTGEELSLPKQTTINQMNRYQCKESRITKNMFNMISPKETNKSRISDPKEMNIYEISEF